MSRNFSRSNLQEPGGPTMKLKQRCSVLILAVLATAFFVPQVSAQTGTVKGTCKGMDGKPLAGATVEFTGLESGRKYTLKTNNKGEYFSLGVAPGSYNIVLSQDGKEIFRFNKVPINSDENVNDFDLKKEQAAGPAGMSEEDKKKLAEQEAKQNKERLDVKSLNDKLAASRAAITAGNFDQAVATMTEATQIATLSGSPWARRCADRPRARKKPTVPVPRKPTAKPRKLTRRPSPSNRRALTTTIWPMPTPTPEMSTAR